VNPQYFVGALAGSRRGLFLKEKRLIVVEWRNGRGKVRIPRNDRGLDLCEQIKNQKWVLMGTREKESEKAEGKRMIKAMLPLLRTSKELIADQRK